jgi:hypothetical protein
MNLDALIERGLEEEAARARLDGPWAASGAGGPRHRGPGLKRWMTMAAAAVLLAAGILVPLAFLAGLLPGERSPGPGGEIAPGEHGPVTFRDTDDGLSITGPRSWTFRQDPSGPDDPPTVFALGTWAFPRGGDCAPTSAQEQLPEGGALVWLIEYRHTPGPQVTFLREGEPLNLDEAALGTYECSAVPSYLVRIYRAGRFFQVHAAFGPKASASLRSQVEGALSTIDVTAPIPEGCPHDTGPWSDPDCPQPAWIRLVLESVGVDEIGETGSAIVARDDGGPRFFIWTTPAIPDERLRGEGYRFQREIQGGKVFPTARLWSDGVRLTWKSQGFNVWLEPFRREMPSDDTVTGVVRGTLGIDYDMIDTRRPVTP